MGKLPKETKEGCEITGAVKHPIEKRVWNFSGGYPKGPQWPAKNIHTDLEFARQCGLKSRALSAAMFVGYLSEFMIDLFGVSWLTHGTMDLKFIAMVNVDEEVVPRAVVTSKKVEGSGPLFSLDVWVHKKSGEKVAVGTTTGIVQ